MATWLLEGELSLLLFAVLAPVLVAPFLAVVYRRYRYPAPVPTLLAAATGLYVCSLVSFTTFPLPEAQLDRFFFRLDVLPPGAEDMARILAATTGAARDEATGRTYYEAVVIPDAAALAEFPGLTLLPGMPVETYLRTRDRTPLSYLTQPMTVYFNRAFREG